MKDIVQENNPNQLKLKVNDTYNRDEKITTNFEPIDDKDIINKAHLDEKRSKIEGQISYSERF